MPNGMFVPAASNPHEDSKFLNRHVLSFEEALNILKESKPGSITCAAFPTGRSCNKSIANIPWTDSKFVATLNEPKLWDQQFASTLCYYLLCKTHSGATVYFHALFLGCLKWGRIEVKERDYEDLVIDLTSAEDNDGVSIPPAVDTSERGRTTSTSTTPRSSKVFSSAHDESPRSFASTGNDSLQVTDALILAKPELFASLEFGVLRLFVLTKDDLRCSAATSDGWQCPKMIGSEKLHKANDLLFTKVFSQTDMENLDDLEILKDFAKLVLCRAHRHDKLTQIYAKKWFEFTSSRLPKKEAFRRFDSERFAGATYFSITPQMQESSSRPGHGLFGNQTTASSSSTTNMGPHSSDNLVSSKTTFDLNSSLGGFGFGNSQRTMPTELRTSTPLSFSNSPPKHFPVPDGDSTIRKAGSTSSLSSLFSKAGASHINQTIASSSAHLFPAALAEPSHTIQMAPSAPRFSPSAPRFSPSALWFSPSDPKFSPYTIKLPPPEAYSSSQILGTPSAPGRESSRSRSQQRVRRNNTRGSSSTQLNPSRLGLSHTPPTLVPTTAAASKFPTTAHSRENIMPRDEPSTDKSTRSVFSGDTLSSDFQDMNLSSNEDLASATVADPGTVDVPRTDERTIDPRMIDANLKQKMKETIRPEGFVYIFESIDRSMVKIGKTNDLYRRGMQIQNGCKIPDLRLFNSHRMRPEYVSRVERLAHAELIKERVEFPCKHSKDGKMAQTLHTEWFRVSKEVADRTVERWSRAVKSMYNPQGDITDHWSKMLESLPPPSLDENHDQRHARYEMWIKDSLSQLGVPNTEEVCEDT